MGEWALAYEKRNKQLQMEEQTAALQEELAWMHTRVRQGPLEVNIVCV